MKFKSLTNIFLFILTFLFNFNLYTKDITYSMLDSSGVPLDLTLIKLMNYKKNGVFIEVGAFDGKTYSNTKLLEDIYGWTGILIEPSKILFEKLCSNRPKSKCYQCALGSFKQNNTYAFGDFDGHPMSSLTGRVESRPNQQKYKVLIRSLQSILDESKINHINFFSLDTEGYEFNILNGIDFKKTIFDYMLIEIYIDEYNKIVSFLKNKGYDMVCCLSNYNKGSNPGWDGTHNDYLFTRRNLK